MTSEARESMERLLDTFHRAPESLTIADVTTLDHWLATLAEDPEIDIYERFVSFYTRAALVYWRERFHPEDLHGPTAEVP